MEKTIKVAVYGTLMTGEANYGWGAGALDRKPCTIRGTLYDTGYGYPAFVPAEDGMDIDAELLTVDAAGLQRMDRLEGYPHHYRRDTIHVLLKDGTETTANVYVMNRMPATATRMDVSWRNRLKARR